VALGLVQPCAQNNPQLVVHTFTFASGMTWSNDMKEMQTAGFAALASRGERLKSGKKKRRDNCCPGDARATQ
jgi:hypothetical protein